MNDKLEQFLLYPEADVTIHYNRYREPHNRWTCHLEASASNVKIEIKELAPTAEDAVANAYTKFLQVWPEQILGGRVLEHKSTTDDDTPF